MIEFDQIEAAIKGALPEGWYAGSPSMEIAWGGGPTRYEVTVHAGRHGPEENPGLRMLEVRLAARTVDDLIGAIHSVKGLESLFDLPYGAEVDVDLYNQ